MTTETITFSNFLTLPGIEGRTALVIHKGEVAGTVYERSVGDDEDDFCYEVRLNHKPNQAQLFGRGLGWERPAALDSIRRAKQHACAELAQK